MVTLIQVAARSEASARRKVKNLGYTIQSVEKLNKPGLYMIWAKFKR